MTKHRSDRPELVLNVIQQFTAANGYAPSIREIMPRVGLASTSTVSYILQRLAREGRIEYEHGISRSLRVVQEKPLEGICARPGCGKPVAGQRPNSKWCSRSCTTIAAHVRRWLRNTGHEYLADQLGLTA